MKPILEALSKDGSIDMKLLKEISQGCLEELKKRHDEGKYLGIFRPALIFYREVGGKIEIDFEMRKIEPTELIDSLSEKKWMAPEMFQKDSKPSVVSDVFSLGLLFFFMLTKRGSPLDFNIKFQNDEIHHTVKIDLQLLEALTKDTDTILFIDLIMRMIKEVPDQRETCESLIEHVAFQNEEGWLEIVQLLAEKCFNGDECVNEYLAKILDKKEVHMEGFLGEDSAEWKELLAEIAKFSVKPNLKICSSILKMFAEQSCLGLLQPIMLALPNFFPHLNNIYREEMPKVEKRPYKDIFEHFNDQANSLGTGSNHTRVYKGKFQRRPIAIKRVVRDLAKIVDREISIMLQTDRHPNILKYFAREETEDFIYIGIELCECNLSTFISDQEKRKKMATKTIFQQTAYGLRHLHKLSIIHRDVKPENILILRDNENYSIKLADFGISKDLSATTLSTLNAPGTLAWIAPEVIRNGHTQMSDVFSLGSVFYFVTFDGTILSKELKMNYKVIELKLKKKQEIINDQGKNEKNLQMEMITRMLKLQPESRPSVEKLLHHPFFWDDKKSLNFILEIRKNFDILDPKFVRKIKGGKEHQIVLQETTIVRQLKLTLDSDKSVILNNWKGKLDANLTDEFTGDYNKESVSDLLKAMRNKWMHKVELKDEIKALFGDGTESNYLNYFTSRFPRLLVHCYNAVEKEARNLLAEYFHQDASAQSPTVAITPVVTPVMGDLQFEGSTLIINCQQTITFPQAKFYCKDLIIENISHLFLEQNKSFTNFLQRIGSNVTNLEFSEGSLKFDSMNKILKKLPNLQEIQFDGVDYKSSKANQTIQSTTCKDLVELKILSAKCSNLVQTFQEYQTVRFLTVWYSNVTLEQILQKYEILKELTVLVDDNYPVNDQHKANTRIHQLKVLNIKLGTEDEKIQGKLISAILKQNNLRQFHFDSDNCNLSQSLCKELAAHICQLERLIRLTIHDETLLEEVEAFTANCRLAFKRLNEVVCQLRHFKSLPSSFLGHFTSLRELHIICDDAEQTKMEDLFSFMNKSQLTSINLEWLPSECFQLFKQLQVDFLQYFFIYIENEPKDEVSVFDILQEFLPRHPNITRFDIRFAEDYDEPKSLELIPMILASLTKLKCLEVVNFHKITADVIKEIAALKTLESWEINDHKSETFYQT